MRRVICVCGWLLLLLFGLDLPQTAAADVNHEFKAGKAHLGSGKYEQAIEAFSAALGSLAPDERNALVVRLARAQAYFEKGDTAAARKDLRAVINSSGLDGEIRANGLQLMGILNLRNKDKKKALLNFTEAIKTPHDNRSLRSASFANRGVAYINLGDPDRAVSDLNKAIELDPKSAFAYAGRGMAELRRDNIETARRDAEKALLLNPDAQTRSMAEKILNDLAVSASGPLSVTVPIGESGRPLVQVRFGKKGKPHRFVLDTGATHTLIDRRLLADIARETEVKPCGKSRVQIADGSTHTVIRYRIKNAFLFHLPLGEIEAGVFEKPMPKVSNLLGMGSFGRIAVSIDKAQNKVEIRRKEAEE